MEMETLRSENSTFRSHVERINADKDKLDNVLRATLYEKTELESKFKKQEKTIKSLEEEVCKPFQLEMPQLKCHRILGSNRN